jgi:hypothetical protein
MESRKIQNFKEFPAAETPAIMPTQIEWSILE